MSWKMRLIVRPILERKFEVEGKSKIDHKMLKSSQRLVIDINREYKHIEDLTCKGLSS